MNRDTVRCFWCEPSERGEESLRRFCFSGAGDTHYHNAEVVIGEVDLPFDATQYGRDNVDHADSRWPTHCPCGYAFQDGDEWQHNVVRKYRRADSGELYTLAKLTPGAMYDADWYPEGRRGCDGIHLIVIGPAKCGAWNPDGPCRNADGSRGARWNRTGDPRHPETLSCSPSIWWGQGEGGDREWHGFLTNGVLQSC